MKRHRTGLVVSLAVLLVISGVTPASAGLKEGMAAYERGDYRAARKELRPLAQQGQTDSLFILGVMALEGKGVPKDLKRAARAFAVAAEKGHAKAQFLYAALHYQGWGVPKSLEKAASWARKSADQGEAEGQHLLGILYVKGEGVQRNYLQGEAWLTKAAALGNAKAIDALSNLKIEIAKARDLGLIPVETQQVAARPSNAVELLSSSGTFRIPPVGTVATYQCKGGGAKTVKYAIEAVDRDRLDGDTLTVKASGDGKDFGTYRRKAWQMAGTTLFDELSYKGKVSKGDSSSTPLASIEKLERNQKVRSKTFVKAFSSIAEQPLPWNDMLFRGSAQYNYQGATTFTISIAGRSEQITNAFGRQAIVSIDEVGEFSAPGSWSYEWSTHLKTEFAPSLGFAIRQEYSDISNYKATCELASIDGPGAAYIAMGPLKSGMSTQTATTNSAAQLAPQPPVKLAVTTDIEPPVLEVPKTIETSGLVAVIAGRVVDKSALSEVSIQGVPVTPDADGRFSIRRGVSIGESEISVAAVDVWGNVTEQIVKVIRTASQPALPKVIAALPAAPKIVKAVDTTPPVIETVAGLKTNLEVETISGRVTDASKIVSVTIEGKPVTIGANGEFSVERKLPIGKSSLRIAAVDTQGNQTETIVSVLRKPHIPKVNYGNYHALVIGNANYEDLPKLQTAVVDAEAVAKILDEEYGFRVKLLTDVTREDMIDAFDILREELGENDNLLVYYAGHGWLDKASSRGYWQPVNAQINRRSKWMSNATLTDSLKALKAKHVMVVADSCYSGVLTRSIKVPDRTIDYIERMASRRARVVLTSGGLEPVMDSGGGKHSVFAEQFLKVLENNTGVLDGTQLFEQVRRPVVLAAPQTPQYSDIRFSGHDGGDFLFVRKY